jgi:predicted deacylase
MDGIQIFTSPKAGKTTLIVGCVHGDEIVGRAVLDYFKQKLSTSERNGTFILLTANREAEKQGVRFLDSDLNRCFASDSAQGDHEQQRAKEIKDFLLSQPALSIDQVFDFHSTATPSDPMIICSDNPASLAMARYFPIPYRIS